MRPRLVSALLSPPPPLVVGWAPPLRPQGGPIPCGEEVPLGEEEEQVGVAGLRLGDLLLRPNHQVQVVLPPDPHDFLGLVHLLQLMGRNIFLLQECVHFLSLCGPVLILVDLLGHYCI